MRLEPRTEIRAEDVETWSTTFFRDMAAALFPDRPAGSVTCHELYLVHLAVVPFESVVRMGRDLVPELRQNVA